MRPWSEPERTSDPKEEKIVEFLKEKILNCLTVMLVVGDTAECCVPSQTDESELKEVLQQLRSSPVHAAMKVKHREDHRVHREAGVAARKRQTHLLKFSGRRLRVPALEVFDVAVEVDWIRAVSAVWHNWLANAEKVRSQSSDRVFSDVGGQLRTRRSEEKYSEVLVHVLNAERDIVAVELHFTLCVHAESPPDILADHDSQERDPKAVRVEVSAGHRRIMERMHQRLVITEKSALIRRAEEKEE